MAKNMAKGKGKGGKMPADIPKSLGAIKGPLPKSKKK